MEILKRILNIFTPQKNGTPQFVDLGLPSGLKWAKCNVGAKKETDYGYYFQWGDIVNKRKSNCGWTRYKHCKGTKYTLTKYCRYLLHGTVTDKSTLDPEDDAATQIMGGDWRMPTAREFQELYDNTTNEWVTNYNSTGVSGRKFTSKNNGNSIFIPASGYAHSERLYDQGICCNCWSSSLSPSSSNCGVNLYFTSKRIEPQDYGYRRYFGFCVRGVRE